MPPVHITRSEAIAQKLPGSDTIRSDHFTYVDEMHRAWGAVLLDREALKAFTDTIVIGKRAELSQHRALVKKWIADGALSAGLDYPQNEWSHAADRYQNYEFLKLGVGLELHLKARLLEQGFVVHALDRNDQQFSPLAQAQKSRPVHLDELRAIDDWRFDGSQNYLPGLLRESLKFAWITSKSDYRAKLGIVSELLDLAERIRRLRNRIHLPIGGTVSRIDPDADERYVSLLVSLVNDHVVEQANRLIVAHGLHIPQLACL